MKSYIFANSSKCVSRVFVLLVALHYLLTNDYFSFFYVTTKSYIYPIFIHNPRE